MAVIDNRATQIGDVLLITATAPILGIISLTDYIDSTEGESVDRFFAKHFRYTTNGGLTWIDWMELTNTNIQAIEVVPSDFFIIEYRYVRSGLYEGGELAFNDITLNGSFSTYECGETYQQSIFHQFFECTDTQVLLWCINVTKKLYEKGIVPNYLERGNLEKSDEDYIDFWQTVAHFFALIVHYARQFETFYQSPQLLLQYLRQEGLYLCQHSDLQEMVYLMNNYFDQMRQRGSELIYSTKAQGKEVDGELLRLLCHNPMCDEFLLCNDNLHVGWRVGLSSPLYSGVLSPQLSKGYTPFSQANRLHYPPHRGGGSSVVDWIQIEDQQIDLLKINTTSLQGRESCILEVAINNDPTSTITVVSDHLTQLQDALTLLGASVVVLSPQTMSITWSLGDRVSMRVLQGAVVEHKQVAYKRALVIEHSNISTTQQIGGLEDIVDYGFVIDPNLSYELSIKFRQQGESVPFTVGLVAIDSNSNEIPLSGHNDLIVGDYNVFFTPHAPQYLNKTYPLLAQLLPHDHNQSSDPNEVQINIWKGDFFSTNLISKSNVCKIIPYIRFHPNAPLNAQTHVLEYSLRLNDQQHGDCFLNTTQYIRLWYKNNNTSQSSSEIEDIMSRFLLPYNASFVAKSL